MIGSKLVYCFLKVTFKIDSLLLKHESLQVKNSASYLLPALLSHSSPCPDHTFPLLLSWFGFTVACLLLLLYINIFSINTFSAFLYYYFWRFLSLYIYSTSLLPCPFYHLHSLPYSSCYLLYLISYKSKYRGSATMHD